MGGNQSKWCSECVLCFHALLLLHDRSIILIRDVSFPEGRGIQQQHGGYLHESETTRRGIITSQLAVHTRLHKCTHINADTSAPKSCALCARLLTTCTAPVCPTFTSPGKTTCKIHFITSYTVAMYTYCNTPIIKQNTRVHDRSATFPMRLILKDNPGQDNFRFAAQLLEIQSSSWLTGWLAPLPNKAPIVWNL